MKYDEMSEASLDYARERLEQREKEIKQSQVYCGTCHEKAITGTPCLKLEHYWTGTNQLIRVHSKAACKFQPCVIHAPSPHKMQGFPTHWRDDRKLMERICPHGVGHPDPDDLSFKKVFMSSAHVDVEAVHGCDGCCAEDDEHYGPYGPVCSSTGQFDAGECWKCQIKRLRKERDEARKVALLSRN